MKMRNSILFAVLAATICGCDNAPPPESEEEFQNEESASEHSVRILDAMPRIGEMKTHKPWGGGEIAEADIDSEIMSAHQLRLSNGLTLVVSDMARFPDYGKFQIAEDDIYLLYPKGGKRLVANGWGFGDYQRDIFFGNDIVIRETFCRGHYCEIKLPVREYELKCTKSDCRFFKTKDCLLDPGVPRPAAEIMADLRKARNEMNDTALMRGLDELFLAAVAGDEKLFLDRKKLYAELGLDAGPSEVYGILREHYDEYKKDCK